MNEELFAEKQITPETFNAFQKAMRKVAPMLSRSENGGFQLAPIPGDKRNSWKLKGAVELPYDQTTGEFNQEVTTHVPVEIKVYPGEGLSENNPYLLMATSFNPKLLEGNEEYQAKMLGYILRVNYYINGGTFALPSVNSKDLFFKSGVEIENADFDHVQWLIYQHAAVKFIYSNQLETARQLFLSGSSENEVFEMFNSSGK